VTLTSDDLPTARVAEPPAPRPARRHVPGEPGVWVLILADMIVFGVFFIVYTHARTTHWGQFTAAQATLSRTTGLVNTLLLLLSSLVVALGVVAVRRGDTTWAPRFFAVGLLCGLAFAVNKVMEYATHLANGSTPASDDFYMYYFILTGIHATHLLIGMCVLGVLWYVAGKPTAQSRIALVEGCASYWHLVDVLWVVLFPLLYLA
jgi:nitric oxide reductase NorE protein